MKILFLSRWFPAPITNGSKLRIYHLLRGLARQHAVTLLSFIDAHSTRQDVAALQAFCQAVRVVPWKSYTPESRQARLGLFSTTPRSIVDTYSEAMAEAVRDMLAAERFDLVIASELTSASYSRHFTGAPALFEDVELGALHGQYADQKSLSRRLRYGLTWSKHRRYVAGLLPHFRACTVVSEGERRLLHAALKPRHQPRVDVIPNCIDLSAYRLRDAARQPHTLIFTGPLAYGANFEALAWFLQQVWPRVLARVPAAQLVATGDPGQRPLPPAPNVRQAGYVDDVQAWIAASAISLAPIWTAAGTRLKILEAMGLRTPVVSTSKGAEGLEVRHNEHLLIGDTPAAFAEAILQLLTTPALQRRLADNAYQLVREKYDWQVTMPRFLALVDGLAISPSPA